MLSLLSEGRWFSPKQSVDDVVGLQVVGTTLREVTASAEGIGYVDRRNPRRDEDKATSNPIY